MEILINSSMNLRLDMINEVSDTDRDLVSKAMVSDDRHALNMFLCGGSKIIFVSVSKEKELIIVHISSSNHSDLHFVFINKASFESLEKILTLEYSYLRIVHTNDRNSLFSSYVNIGVYCMYNEILRITSKIYQDNTADDDEKWNDFYESNYDDYMVLLSEYLNENTRFIESINKRLEAASDSDKLLAMIGDK